MQPFSRYHPFRPEPGCCTHECNTPVRNVDSGDESDESALSSPSGPHMETIAVSKKLRPVSFLDPFLGQIPKMGLLYGHFLSPTGLGKEMGHRPAPRPTGGGRIRRRANARNGRKSRRKPRFRGFLWHSRPRWCRLVRPSGRPLWHGVFTGKPVKTRLQTGKRFSGRWACRLGRAGQVGNDEKHCFSVISGRACTPAALNGLGEVGPVLARCAKTGSFQALIVKTFDFFRPPKTLF